MRNVSIVRPQGRDVLGEGPVWIARQNALFWVDIYEKRLNRWELNSAEYTSWRMPDRIGWLIERKDRMDFVIGLKSGFATLCLDPFEVFPVGNPEPDRPGNRLNDAKADLTGRIWAGSKDDRDNERPIGALYRLDPGFKWSRQDDGYLCTNGPAFSRDGKTMYHADSGRRIVFAFDINDAGDLSNKRNFIEFDPSWGYPDGMTTDVDGGIWIAHWGGARITRFHSDGTVDRSITMPATNITSVAFGGANLDRMFVTSAAFGCEGEPHAGALFEVDAGVRGLPPASFAG